MKVVAIVLLFSADKNLQLGIFSTAMDTKGHFSSDNVRIKVSHVKWGKQIPLSLGLSIGEFFTH